MALKSLRDISYRAFTATTEATGDAAKAAYDITGTAVSVTFNALGAGFSYTLDGIEYVDDGIDRADLAIESAAGTAGRKTASIFGDHAEPHGERAGKIVYKAAKIALNFVQLPGMFRESIDLIRQLRR